MTFVAGQKISWMSFGKRVYGSIWSEWKEDALREISSICAIAEEDSCRGTHFHPRIIEDEVKAE